MPGARKLSRQGPWQGGGETGLLRGKKDELSVRARVYGIVRKLCCDREFMRQD